MACREIMFQSHCSHLHWKAVLDWISRTPRVHAPNWSMSSWLILLGQPKSAWNQRALCHDAFHATGLLTNLPPVETEWLSCKILQESCKKWLSCKILQDEWLSMQPIVSPLATHRQPIGNPSATHRQPIGNPSATHRQPIGNPSSFNPRKQKIKKFERKNQENRKNEMKKRLKNTFSDAIF